MLDFRPWIVSGHQDLVSAFFKILAEKLPGTNRPRWIDRLLRGVRGTADPLLDAVATVAVVVDPTGGVASKAAATITGKTLNRMVDRFLTDSSLQAAYVKLCGVLKKTNKRFLVIIDDLDRLQKDEIRSIMQMVKTVGRLPSVIYLLAYDRRIVWASLDEGLTPERDGPNFGEKIVQQEIELPRPAKEDLLVILDSELSFLAGPTQDTTRWQILVRNGVWRWIRHPRDVQRLANAVKFSWPALEGEIDPQDLLVMEGMRLFDEAVFDWVRWNRDWLFRQNQYLLAEAKTRQVELKLLTDHLPEREQERVLQMMAALFPGEYSMFGMQLQHESYSETVRRRGVGCKAGYDAYFSLYPSPNEVPKSVIDAAMANLTDEHFLVDLIKRYVEKKDRRQIPLVGRLLQEFAFRFTGGDRAMPTQQLLDALFKVGEAILSEDSDDEPFRISPRIAFAGLIREMMKVWGESEAGKHLEVAFVRSTSPMVNAEIFVARARELGVIPGGSGDLPLITTQSLHPLGNTLLSLIETAATDGRLVSAPFYWGILGAWKYLGGADAAKSWINANANTSAGFLSKLTLGLVGHSVGRRERTYIVHQLPDSDLYDLEAILAAAMKHLAGRELTKDARSRIEVVAEAIASHLNTNKKSSDSPTAE